MTPAQGINSSCGFSRVFVAEAKPERMAIAVKLFQPGLNERREREIIAHERLPPWSRAWRSGAVPLRLPIVSATSHTGVWKPPCRGWQVGESASPRLDVQIRVPEICRKSRKSASG